ncbi:MAG TPA: TetR/AcrR family transcriptional regulator [Spirochaetota bacterium]|nr:TetR/AcrR family transcriptional regulator [Spirochaetota bacterium]HOM10790.1 TetR/AcrR family transcriptional regulator [Spirochaetota bacterium]HPP50622.1 TetR/AcrR family transcriptional regulator [Spirochaetota bacterium]HXK65557.1 TetR/AcrR family transcriptional regulator [Spirochaetota bacterium]
MSHTIIDKRQQILDVAKELFATKGYSATGIREIAEKAGLSLGNFYNYFKNKEDLFKSLLDPQNILEHLTEIKLMLNDGFPFNFKDIIKSIKTVVDSDFHLYRLIFIDLTEFNGMHTDKILDRIITEATATFNANVKNSIVGTVIKDEDYQFYIKAFIISTLSLLVIGNILPSANLNDKSNDYIAEKLSNVILHGILL